ncbi:MAG: hypothetical protein JRN52_00415 [Nitrososphaerota archaeon]|nr:hypothetical protein [Nitrososphaerota archaeon]
MIMDASEYSGTFSDSDTVIRMLYFCETPRTPAQIMLYCGIDGIQLTRFTKHCLRRNLVKFVMSEMGPMSLVITEHGKEVLSKSMDILKELNLSPEVELGLYESDEIER